MASEDRGNADPTCQMSQTMASLLDWREPPVRPVSERNPYDIYHSDNPDRRLIRTPLEPFDRRIHSMNTQIRIGGNRRKVGKLLLPIGMLAGGMSVSLALPLGAYASTPGAAKATVVKAVSGGQFGKILTTTSGAALYTYSKDTKNHSNVTGALLAAWPPLVVPAGTSPTGNSVAGLGIIKRTNGQEQVTYRGKPLYTFVKDMGNQVTGQGVKGFSVVKLPTTKAAPKATMSSTKSPTKNGIPQNNGGDGDADNNGGPSDGDGNI
jgi:predicted lipoprotein with Yx(FWY)xxD motif